MSQIGGYQGPVVVLTADGVELAHAACRYKAEIDARGTDHWQGSLHRVQPGGAVTIGGSYRLRFPDGEQGEVTIERVRDDGEFLYFAGSGRRPINPW
jgi:hypothetical protein